MIEPTTYVVLDQGLGQGMQLASCSLRRVCPLAGCACSQMNCISHIGCRVCIAADVCRLQLYDVRIISPWASLCVHGLTHAGFTDHIAGRICIDPPALLCASNVVHGLTDAHWHMLFRYTSSQSVNYKSQSLLRMHCLTSRASFPWFLRNTC